MAWTILPCVWRGKSQISSKKRVPWFACSNNPTLELLVLFLSITLLQPNSTCSTLSGDKVAQDAIIKGKEALFDFLWINLAVSSFPDPDGPVIKILLLLVDNLFNCVLIFLIAKDLPISSIRSFSLASNSDIFIFKLRSIRAFSTSNNNRSDLKGFSIKSKAPVFAAIIAVSMLPWPDIIITGIKELYSLLHCKISKPALVLLFIHMSVIIRLIFSFWIILIASSKLFAIFVL